MKELRKFISLLLVFALTLSLFPVEGFARDKDYDRSESRFSDMDNDHWAYESVMKMVEHGIIEGYSDGRFKPSEEVSRAEFAKMMVLTLDLPLTKPDHPSFEDVSKKDWEYPYVETAKYYLTGFRTSNGDLFKSDTYAVREDMAVALVKALNYNPDKTNLKILNDYKDEDFISPNLRKYVATIIDKGIMIGNDNKYFSPQGSLTRAEAAVLLSRLINEEKVTYDEEKVTYDRNEDNDDDDDDEDNDDDEDDDDEDIESPSEEYIPYVVSAITDDGIVLEWNKVNADEFKYYKVVVSKYNRNPKYPDDGYLVCIDNINTTRYVIKPYAKYNNSDFGGKILPGESYYISITAVYKDERIAGNTIHLTMPQ